MIRYKFHSINQFIFHFYSLLTCSSDQKTILKLQKCFCLSSKSNQLSLFDKNSFAMCLSILTLNWKYVLIRSNFKFYKINRIGSFSIGCLLWWTCLWFKNELRVLAHILDTSFEDVHHHWNQIHSFHPSICQFLQHVWQSLNFLEID